MAHSLAWEPYEKKLAWLGCGEVNAIVVLCPPSDSGPGAESFIELPSRIYRILVRSCMP